MTANLWSCNAPDRFWQCQPGLPQDAWRAAIQKACPILGISIDSGDIDGLLAKTLGEGQFGVNHWELAKSKQLYYLIKPFVPRKFRNQIRSILKTTSQKGYNLRWPIEDRYVRFQWEVMRQLLNILGTDLIHFINFWPEQFDFSFVLTHDVETGLGQSFVQAVADLEESLGFRSSFNFVISDYTINYKVVEDLRGRGFEIGIHGLNHNNKLFSSLPVFREQVKTINEYLRIFEAVGFRSPSTYRQPEWMQSLEIEYDSSFFDTDPWEPIPGGTMSIWPFRLGRFIELPYTLVQDNTLVNILRQDTPTLWKQKVEFIQRYHGMVLLNTHPDYLRDKVVMNVYTEFLKGMKELTNYWHALPNQVAHWWLCRNRGNLLNDSFRTSSREVKILGEELVIY